MIAGPIAFIFLFSFLGHDSALLTADVCFYSMHYDEAATEYKRYIHFHREPGDPFVGDSYYQLGVCLRNIGRFQESLDAFQSSLQWKPGRWDFDSKRLAAAVVLLALGRHSEAKFALLKLEISAESVEVQKRAILLRAITALYEDYWDEAQSALQLYIELPPTTPEDDPIQEVAQQFIMGKKSIRLKSKNLAKILSTFVPGSGQLYSEDWKGGANALALNGIFGYLLYRDLASQNYLQAALSSFFIFKRFYIGNRRNATKAADAYNDAKNRRLALLLIEALEKHYDK